MLLGFKKALNNKKSFLLINNIDKVNRNADFDLIEIKERIKTEKEDLMEITEEETEEQERDKEMISEKELEIELNIDGESVALKKGDAMLIPSDAVMGTKVLSTTPAEILSVGSPNAFRESQKTEE